VVEALCLSGHRAHTQAKACRLSRQSFRQIALYIAAGSGALTSLEFAGQKKAHLVVG